MIFTYAFFHQTQWTGFICSINKAAKDFLKRKFEEWYATEIEKQFGARGQNIEESTLHLQPIINSPLQ